MKNYDPIALCEYYEPLEYLSKEIMRKWKRESEPAPEPYYDTEPDGEMFFYIGNTRIKVSEHFNDYGKTIDELLKDVIKYSAKSAL